MSRRELENEKKANQKLVEQKRVMEKNLESMAHELEELRAELMSINMRGHELGNWLNYLPIFCELLLHVLSLMLIRFGSCR